MIPLRFMAKFPPRFSAFLSAAVCLACAAAPFAAEKPPSGTIWKDFRILCVSPPDREEDLLSLLHAAGLHEYATESNSAFLPSQSMAPFIPFLKEANALRSQWFYDESGAFRVVYINERGAPQRYAEKLAPLLESSGFSWVIERNGGFVLLPCALLFFFSLFVALFCRPFPAVLAALAFPYLFALAGGDFSSWLFSFFWICGAAVYSASVFPPRRTVTKGQLAALSRKAAPVFLPWFAAAVVSALVSGRGILMLAVPAGSAAAFIFAKAMMPSFLSGESLAFALKARRRAHPAFKPDLLLVRGKMPFASPVFRLGKSLSPLLVSFAGILLACAVMIPAALWAYGRQGAAFFAEKEKKKSPDALYIPAPEMYTSSSGFSAAACMEAFGMGSRLAEDESGFLFSLSDFTALQWNVFAYPWRKISQPLEFPREGAAIQYLDYKETASGALSGEKATAGRFDSDFIMMIFEKYASPLEKMLIRQGRFSTVKRRQLPR